MKKLFTIFATLLCLSTAFAQSGLYIPVTKSNGKATAKNNKKKQQAPVFQNAEAFCLLLTFQEGDSALSLSDLDLLDSAYRIAFDEQNPMLYTMLIEGYGTNDSVTADRVETVRHYFANRTHSLFPVRYAYNSIHCSCHGDTVEKIRYEVPVSVSVYNQNELPSARMQLNSSIPLHNSVLVTFRNNPDECIGLARGCYLPSQDSTIRGYYVTMDLKRGSVYAVDNTKDSCPPPLHIDIEEHLDYHNVVERYFLIPHRKNILVNAGYVVLHSNFNRTMDECALPLLDSIYMRFPITQEQWENKVRVYVKVKTEKGIEYKNIPAKKIKTKGTSNIYLQVTLNPSQFDTVFLGKRIKIDEVDDYFYEIETNREVGSFTLDNAFYKAYQLDKNGDYKLKSSLLGLFRVIEEEKDEEEVQVEMPKSDEDIEE